MTFESISQNEYDRAQALQKSNVMRFAQSLHSVHEWHGNASEPSIFVQHSVRSRRPQDNADNSSCNRMIASGFGSKWRNVLGARTSALHTEKRPTFVDKYFEQL
jgi:hypothetical protein